MPRSLMIFPSLSWNVTTTGLLEPNLMNVVAKSPSTTTGAARSARAFTGSAAARPIAFASTMVSAQASLGTAGNPVNLRLRSSCGAPAVGHTPGMEPETHRFDREAMLADRRAVAERVQREVDELVAAAAEKRRVSFERFVDDLRVRAATEREYERVRSQGALGPGKASAQRPPIPVTG